MSSRPAEVNESNNTGTLPGQTAGQSNKPGTKPGGQGERNVHWVDSHGYELAQVREFEPRYFHKPNPQSINKSTCCMMYRALTSPSVDVIHVKNINFRFMLQRTFTFRTAITSLTHKSNGWQRLAFAILTSKILLLYSDTCVLIFRR